ncbi:hypothetical protein BCR44DRAFT_42052 [Catenaria anguillulae PL171]|uniref:Uncharacterized protein n=1 Tax=Catenaria anguillulae PL171 TaxID=765915 RepID=A0A1Y2HY50_9FUNG|nr:hypothetical protein BCR44DRAFT_42052 [Catenaria anguillulae PL171]
MAWDSTVISSVLYTILYPASCSPAAHPPNPPAQYTIMSRTTVPLIIVLLSLLVVLQATHTVHGAPAPQQNNNNAADRIRNGVIRGTNGIIGTVQGDLSKIPDIVGGALDASLPSGGGGGGNRVGNRQAQ